MAKEVVTIGCVLEYINGLLYKTQIQIAMDSSDSGAVQKNEGSWIPLIILISVLLIRWLCYSDGNLPIQVRRWIKARVR